MSERMIEFSSGVNLDGKPFIHLEWHGQRAQLTPEEAIKHALGIIEVAQGALTDAFFVSFIRDRLNIPVEKSWPLLKEFRDYREARVSTYDPRPERKEGKT